jgi:predicted Zn-dependent protease
LLCSSIVSLLSASWSCPVRLFCFLLLAGLLAGCASRSELRAQRQSPPAPPAATAPAHGQRAAWPLAALAAVPHPRIGLNGPAGERWLDTGSLRSAWAAAGRLLAAVPGARPEFVLVDGDGPNAFALRHENRDLIAVTVGMSELLGEDEPAWAALLGHELAHLNLRHREGRQQRRQETEGIGAVASILLTVIGLPLAPLFTDAASAMAEKGYNRDDERAADEAGITYMQRAGYPPAGAVRLFEKLAGAADGPLLGFLSTHPGSRERLDAARALAQAAPAVASDPAPDPAAPPAAAP